MIDWHSHILPGIDDGPAEMDQSIAMAAALSAAGFTTVYCTPHLMRGVYEATNDQVRRGVEELQGRVRDSGIPLTLLPGREYWLDEYLPVALDDPLPLGESRLILVEIPPRLTGEMVRRLLYDVVRAGFTPVVAHPERCPLLEPVVRTAHGSGLMGSLKGLFGVRPRMTAEQEAPDATGNQLLDYLRDLGCCFQGNLGSFNGFYGGHVRAVAGRMRTLEVCDRYGSDLHAPEQAHLILGPEGRGLA